MSDVDKGRIVTDPDSQVVKVTKYKTKNTK